MYDANKKTIVSCVQSQLPSTRKKAKKLVENDSYILWLEHFTKTHPHFTNALNQCSTSELSLTDCQNISNLYCFFFEIEYYANTHSISSQIEELSFPNEYYVIVYNNIYYQIGLINLHGTFAYCERIEKIPTKVIDFNDIITYKQH